MPDLKVPGLPRRPLLRPARPAAAAAGRLGRGRDRRRAVSARRRLRAKPAAAAVGPPAATRAPTKASQAHRRRGHAGPARLPQAVCAGRSANRSLQAALHRAGRRRCELELHGRQRFGSSSSPPRPRPPKTSSHDDGTTKTTKADGIVTTEAETKTGPARAGRRGRPSGEVDPLFAFADRRPHQIVRRTAADGSQQIGRAGDPLTRPLAGAAARREDAGRHLRWDQPEDQERPLPRLRRSRPRSSANSTCLSRRPRPASCWKSNRIAADLRLWPRPAIATRSTGAENRRPVTRRAILSTAGSYQCFSK